MAAFDAAKGGVVSAGDVGFDISCGVRTMLTGLKGDDIQPAQKSLADSVFRQIPAGVGSEGAIMLYPIEMNAMLSGGARWAVERGWGKARDLERIEEGGVAVDARPDCVFREGQAPPAYGMRSSARGCRASGQRRRCSYADPRA